MSWIRRKSVWTYLKSEVQPRRKSVDERKKTMKRKDLEALGLEKEVVDKIMDMNGSGIEAEKSKTRAAEQERD